MRHFTLYLLLTLLLAIFLQLTCAYDFLYAEQFRLFLFTIEYAAPFFANAGGLVELLDSFTLQFFAFPYCGAVITAMLFLLMVLGMDLLLKTIAPRMSLPFFGIVIGLMQVGLSTETFYSLSQTWAQIISVWLLIPYASCRRYRYFCSFFLSLLAYYIVGMYSLIAIVLMFVITFKDKERQIHTFISLALSLFVVVGIMMLTSTNDIAHTWTLTAYYGTFMSASNHSYFVPAVMFIAVVTAVILHNKEYKKHQKPILYLQIVCAIFFGGWYFILCHGLEPSRVKKLEVWRWNKEWNRILAEDMPTSSIPLYANYQNLALAASGHLGDEFMYRGQCGTTGLQQVWQGLQQESDLLSDIFMQQGHVAMAQKMAFTAMQGNRGLIHGRMMLRLIETNLILGADKVAEKYINILSQTIYYKDQAEQYRKYIGHPELISNDKYMGELQRCTKGCDWCPNDLEEGLKQIVEANPSYRNALEYLGCYYLLNKDPGVFRQFLNTYHSYPGLNPMPKSFQQAAHSLLWHKPVQEETK